MWMKFGRAIIVGVMVYLIVALGAASTVMAKKKPTPTPTPTPAPPSTTRLLFSFVTNQAGYDTGIAISNTSSDPFGTKPESGTCTLSFFGAAAPSAPVTTSSIASGTTYTTLASINAPGFQGYMIADCGFNFAHGFAFVTSLGAHSFSAGYSAVVLGNPRTVPESLGQ